MQIKTISFFIAAIFFAAFSRSQTKVSIDSISSHIGDSITVCSKVFSTRYLDRSNRQPTFLDLGADYPNSLLTVVIFGDNRQKFTGFPEVLYANKNICITGKLQDFKGRPEIIVTTPEQIKAQ